MAGTLAEVRERIDAVDEAIVGLLAERLRWVQQATRFKASADEVPAPARQQEVLERVRALACAPGGQPPVDGLDEVVDATYRALVAASIACQRRWFDDTEPLAGDAGGAS